MTGVRVINARSAPAEPLTDGPAEMTGTNQFIVKRAEESDGPAFEAGLFTGEAASGFDWEPAFNEVIYIIDGRGTLTADGYFHRIVPGDMLYIPRGTQVHFEFDGPWREVFVLVG